MHFRSETHAAIFRAVQAAGWTWRKARQSGHIVVICPSDHTRRLMLSTHAFEGTGVKKTRASFRTAGLPGEY